MAPQVIVEGDVAYQVEGEYDEDGKFLSQGGEVVSEAEEVPEPAPAPKEAPKQERPRFDNPNPRRATAPAKVEVIDLPASEETPAEEEPTDEELEAWERELDEWIDQQVETRVTTKVEAETRRVQSAKDKEVAKEAKKASVLESRLAELEEQLEQARLEGLTDDEKASYRDTKAIEKKRAEVEAAAKELEEIYRSREVELLVAEYGYCGVTAEDLEDIEDSEKAEKFCKQAERFYLVAGGKKPGSESAKAEETPAAKPAPKAERPTPAGARAPSDVGGGSPVLGKARQFNEAQSLEAMAENLNSQPWETVRIG